MPRFYFIGDDDLLEILGQAQNPAVIQAHLKKLFQGVHQVEFSSDNKFVTALKDVQGEVVKLDRDVEITENVEDIGTLFIDARVKKGLTQEDASKILKVRISAIKQIESGEELGSLGSAYRLGFLRSYAKLVDLDPENIIKNYKSSNSDKNI